MFKTNATLDTKQTKQTIDGIGACGAFHQGHHIEQIKNESTRNVIMDLLFSKENGIGLSILRSIVGDSGEWGNELDGPTPSIEPEKGVFNFTTDDQLWFMKEAQKRGCDRFFSTVWSPPAWMKTNGSVIGGSLKASCYQDFAEYLAAYIKGYKEHHGIEMTAISPANEPDLLTSYSSCIWTGDQYADFLKNYLKPEFERQGITTPVVAPELVEYSEKAIAGHRGLGYKSLFEDDEAMDAVGIIGMHFYEESKAVPLKDEYRRGKPFWMTEYCELAKEDFVADNGMRSGLKIAESIHDFFVSAEGNAYILFWATLADAKNGNGALVYLDRETEEYTVCKRAYTVGNFSRFVRPDAVRLAITETPVEGVSLSAYRNADGSYAVVALNRLSQSCQITVETDAALGELIPYCTCENESLNAHPAVKPNEDGSYTLLLKPCSVTTFVSKADTLK